MYVASNFGVGCLQCFQDKQKVIDEGTKAVTFGKKYYQRLKSEYVGGYRAENKLAVKAASVKLDLSFSLLSTKLEPAGRTGDFFFFLEFCETSTCSNPRRSRGHLSPLPHECEPVSGRRHAGHRQGRHQNGVEAELGQGFS